MTPDRWRVITDLFHGARARDSAARVAFVADACQKDLSLRAEVEALLAAHDEAGSFGNTRACAVQLEQLSPGTQLGPYRIESLIGAGGMGEVYRAKDARLDRTVAIKILPAHLRTLADLQARFEREARTISQLTHPNICTLHDIGHESGVDFLVMEYLEGETLAARLSRGTIPLDHALRIGVEIAAALDHAHRHGIVHRDLKPGNVMLTKSGAKLLDFGLAKLRLPAGAIAGSIGTVQAVDTAAGTLLGTLQYMSPEQLEGREADARSDIWALGCVLYELATGRRAFDAESQVSLIAAILEHEPPPIGSTQALVPPLLDHIVRTCLRKDPDERWQSVADVTRQLQWLAEAPSGAASQRRRGPARDVLLAGGIFAGGLALGLGLFAFRSAPSQRYPAVRAELDIAPAEELHGGGSHSQGIALGGANTAFAWTPDGRSLVIAAQRDKLQQLYVRALDGKEARPISGTEGALVPVLSHDGEWVAFWSHGAIRKVPVGGGTPTVIVPDLPMPPNGMSWGENEELLYAPGRGGDGRIWRAPPAGEPTAVTTRQPGEREHTLPSWLPGARAFLYTVRRRTFTWGDEQTIAQIVETGERRVILRHGVDARYAGGMLVFLRLGTLFGAPFNPDRLTLENEPLALLGNVSESLTGSNTYLISGAGQFSVASDGTLAYVPGPVVPYVERTLVNVRRDGHVRPLAILPAAYAPPVRISPRGDQLAVSLESVSDHALWVVDLVRGVPTRLSRREANWPLWMPDGRSIAYNTFDGQPELLAQPADGSAPVTRLGDELKPSSASPDGRYIVGVVTGPPGVDVWVLDRSAQPPTQHPLLETSAVEQWPALSPDGRWLGYGSDESGRSEIYIRPFPGPGPRRQVSIAGGGNVAWNPDGHEIFFVEGLVHETSAAGPARPTGRLRMMAVPITDGRPVGRPRMLFDFPIDELLFSCRPLRCYDVAPDGQSFYVTQLGQAPSPPRATHIKIAQNWLQEVKARLQKPDGTDNQGKREK